MASSDSDSPLHVDPWSLAFMVVTHVCIFDYFWSLTHRAKYDFQSDWGFDFGDSKTYKKNQLKILW
jgi:hypothetical protein